MACEHQSFLASCDVHRLSHDEGGPIDGYSINVSVKCTECGLAFRFKGLPAGTDPDFPRLSIDGCELRAPLEPADVPKFASEAGYRIMSKPTVQ